jgi:anti-sigma B factor antagonist
MEVAVEIIEGKPVLVFSRRLDDEAAGRFNRELSVWVERLLTKGVADLALEFSGVSYITSAILRSLLSMAKRVRARGGTLCILNPSAEIQETFGVIGFREIFESYGGKFRLSLPAVQLPQRVPTDAAQLDIIVGNRVFACAEGDTLGTEGSLGPELFSDLPGVAARPVRFQSAGTHWVALVPPDPGSIVRVDSQVVAPGQEAILKGDHVLQIGEVRVRVHVTLPEGTSREGEPINVQVQSVFSQTAEWIDKTLKE